ncbi:MAG: 2-C-methyl-D-erythritol 4-phosphate cytidylyltransferase [Prevotella sp.]|nr:2-C-methyl-D-erythritol 4-phosphate cytidylyltransferase [Prevotella sp.]
MTKDYIIIVAGGKGQRMGSSVPKQFLLLCGKPVLMHTIEAFHSYSTSLEIILVLPEEQQTHWKELCEEYGFTTPHTVVSGGSTRFESSRNGISVIPDDADGVVGIHDGVRPLVSAAVIDRCYESARENYAAIPVMPLTDTLRFVGESGCGRNVLRSDYVIVQTPQVFDIALAKRAFSLPYKESFTDDASVVEDLGCQVSVVEGCRENIKLTTPFDMKVAETILHG